MTDVDNFADADLDQANNETAIAVSAVDGALATVVLQATNDIFFDVPVNVASSGVGITAQAGNDITVDASLTTNDGNITFSANDPGGTQTGSGAINVNAAIDGGGGTISMTTNGGTGAINLGANVSSSGGGTGIIFSSNVALTSSPITIDAGNNFVRFDGLVDGDEVGARALVVNAAGSSTTRFNAAVGSVTPLLSLTTNAGGTVRISAPISTSGGMAFQGPVVVVTDSTLTDTGGVGVTFGSTVNGQSTGGQALTLDVAGTTTFSGVVGGSTSLASITTDVAGTTAINGGSVTTTGSQSYSDAVTLGAGTQTLAASALSFGSTLDGPGGLDADVAGATTFSGIVGGTTSLVSIDTDAAGTTAISGGSVTTTGSQAYNDAVSLAAGTQTLGASALSFGSTLDGPGGLDADVAGATTFSGIVGGTTSLASIDTDAAGTTAINGGSVTTTGSQTYNDAVSLGAGMQTLTASALSFGSTLDGPGGLDADVAGATTFSGIVGGTTSLASIDTDAAGTTAINGGSVTTTGSQTYNDAVSLGAGTQTLAASALSFGSTLDGSGGLDADVAGATTFSGIVGGTTSLASIDTDAAGTTAINGGSVTTTGSQTYNDAASLGAGTQTLTASALGFGSTLDGPGGLDADVAGATTFSGIVGGTTSLASMDTDAAGMTAINGGSVTTTGTQTYNDTVNLAAGTQTLTASALSFGSTLDGPGALDADVAGATSFSGAVGGTTSLASIDTDAPGTTAINGGSVTTTGSQTYNDAVSLGAGTQTLMASALSFGSTLDGPGGLDADVAGATTFSGIVGGTTSLASIDTDAAGTTAINGGSVTTTGSQAYNDSVNLAAGTQTLAASALSFGSTLDGPGGLDADVAGATTFSGIVGGTTSLASIDTDAAGTTAINGGSVTTTGSQTYNDVVHLAAGTQTLGASGLSFGSTLDGPGGLDADVAGATAFGGIVGGTTSLASIDTDAAGTTAINGGLVTTTGSQTYNDAASLGAGTQTLTASALSFGSTLDGPGALDADVAGATTFSGIVGGTTSLASIDADAAGTTAINGGSVTTTGSQTYNDAVSLAAGTQTLVASTLSFGSTLDGPGALDADVVGATTFSGVVGGAASLASINTDAAGTTAINGGSITTAGSQTYNDAVSLAAGTQTLGALALSFESTLDGPGGLDADVAGATTFSGIVGGTASLASIDTDAAGTTAVNGGSVTTTGSQTYNDAVSLGAGMQTLTASALSFGSTLDGPGGLDADVAGATTFSGILGGTTSLASIDTDAPGTTAINASVRTSGGTMTFNDAVSLTGAATLTDTGGTGVTFNSTVDGAQNLILAVTGITTFNGAVGGTTPIGDGVGPALTVNSTGTTTFASTLATASGITQADSAGAVTFRDHVTLGDGDTDTTLLADVVLDGLTFTANDVVTFGSASTDQVTLSGSAVTVTTSDDAVTFNAHVDGAQALVVNAGIGTTNFNALVGSTTPLLSVTTDAGGRTEIGASMSASGGSMTFNDPVELTGATTLTDTGGTGMLFNNTVDGAHDLTLDVAGPTTFVGSVGGTTPIGAGVGPAIAINSAGATAFESSVDTDGPIVPADDAGPVTFADEPAPGEPPPVEADPRDPNPVLPEIWQAESVVGIDAPLASGSPPVDVDALVEKKEIRADDMTVFLECIRLTGDPTPLPMDCPDEYATLAAIPEQGELPPVAGRGERSDLRAGQLVVMAQPIGHPERPPSAAQLKALRHYRGLIGSAAKPVIARAVESYRAEEGVREVKGSDLRRYIEGSSSHAHAASLLNSIGELLKELRASGMTREGLLRATMRVLEELSSENLSAVELGRAAEETSLGARVDLVFYQSS